MKIPDKYDVCDDIALGFDDIEGMYILAQIYCDLKSILEYKVT
jgi:hypothetical protein